MGTIDKQNAENEGPLHICPTSQRLKHERDTLKTEVEVLRTMLTEFMSPAEIAEVLER